MRWKVCGGTHKSDVEATWLVHEVLQAPDFNFDASKETCWMEAAQKKISQDDLFRIDKWWCMSVNISIGANKGEKQGR